MNSCGIKSGQTWICIKDYNFEETDNGDIIGEYKYGEIVKVKELYEYENYLKDFPGTPYFYSEEDFYHNGYIVILESGFRNLRIKEFQEHFINLAEWREKQINSILDDE